MQIFRIIEGMHNQFKQEIEGYDKFQVSAFQLDYILN